MSKLMKRSTSLPTDSFIPRARHPLDPSISLCCWNGMPVSIPFRSSWPPCQHTHTRFNPRYPTRNKRLDRSQRTDPLLQYPSSSSPNHH